MVIDFFQRSIVADRLICYNDLLFIPIEMGNSEYLVNQVFPLLSLQ